MDIQSQFFASSLWVIKWVRRMTLGFLAACGVVFVSTFVIALVRGQGPIDALGMALIVTILAVVTPISLITTGKLPYIDL